MSHRQTHKVQIIRDIIIFGVGIAGIVYETLVEKADRPSLLILFAAMVGLPTFLRGDEWFTTKDKEKEDESSS